MHPSRLLLVPAAALALAACSPRPPDAHPDAGRRAAAAPRADAPAAAAPARSRIAEEEQGQTRPASAVAAGPAGSDPKAASAAQAAPAPSRDPATAMGAPAAPRSSTPAAAASTAIPPAAGAAAATAAAAPAALTRVDDAQLTARVKAELGAARDLGDVRIDVDARDGVVTLSGAVRSAAIKARASEIARSVRGVTEVNDQLTLATS